MTIKKRTTKEQKSKIVDLYNSGYSSYELAEIYNISPQAIWGLLKRRNVQIRNNSQCQRKYDLDETFFDTIETQEQAYFLGILYADGHNNTERCTVNLSLKKSDKSILVKLNSLLQPNKPLQYVKIKKENTDNQYRLVICSKRISQRLSNLGCPNRKTHILTFPDFLSDDLLRHFIRGYYDGDGSLTIRNRHSNSLVTIVSTKCFCGSLRNILRSTISVNSGMRPRHKDRNNNIVMLEISGNLQNRRFLEWIYNDSIIHLDRKYNKYLDFILFHNNLIS